LTNVVPTFFTDTAHGCFVSMGIVRSDNARLVFVTPENCVAT
jgi:hypothetical protein